MTIDVSASAVRAKAASAEAPCTGALAEAIISTIVYNDMFGYPPDAASVHRYLHGARATEAEVREELARLEARGTLVADGGRYALPGREHFFTQRRQRADVASELWSRARWFAALFASLPTVRMVAVTGSLAVDNTEAGADIDYMLVVDDDMLWRTRAVARAIQFLEHKFRGTLCVNYLVTTKAMASDRQSLYIAHELTQMVPLYGLETYDALRAANPWIGDFLPNAPEAPRTVDPVKGSALLRAIGRPFAYSRLGDWLERRVRDYKLHVYNETDFLPGRYTPFTAQATGHCEDVRERVEALHRSRVDRECREVPMSVLFGQAYHLRFDPKLWREMRPYPPLGSLYGAAVARDAGYDVQFYDSMLATGNDRWSMALDRFRPDIVVLYEDNFNYLTKMCLGRMRDAALRMIEGAKRVGAQVVVCGSDASDNAAIYLDGGADYVIRGEGEGPLSSLLAYLEQRGTDPSGLRGISYVGADGAVIANPSMPNLRHLDELPMPAWDLVNLRKYRRIWRLRDGRFSLNLVTTRGCPYHCNWCSKPIWGQQYSTRSPESVVAELRHLVDAAGPDHIWFMDDIFGLKPNWVRRFADALRAEDIRVGFKCLTRPDLLKRPGEIEALADAGCETVWIGAESGSQKVLDAMEKGTSIADIESMTHKLKAHGIKVGWFVQFGYPGETFDDIRQTVAMLRRLVPEEVGISVSYPLPGTPFYERVRAQLGEKRNWNDSDDLAMMFEGPFDTRFYRHLHRHVHRDLRWWRTLAGLRDGTVFRLGAYQACRRVARFVIDTAVYPFSWAKLRVLQQLGQNDAGALPVALDRSNAARPAEQDTD